MDTTKPWVSGAALAVTEGVVYTADENTASVSMIELAS